MASLTPSVAAPTTPSNIAEWVMTQTEGILSDAINGPMQALFEALMPVIVVGLTLQFVVYAFALMHGQSNMTVTEFLSFSEGDSTNYQKSAARFFLTVDVTSENGK